MSESYYIEIYDPKDWKEIIELEGFKSITAFCGKAAMSKSTFDNAIYKNRVRVITAVQFTEFVGDYPQFKKLKFIDPQTYRLESFERCLRAKDLYYDDFPHKDKMTYSTFKNYLHKVAPSKKHRLDFTLMISAYIETKPIKSKKEQTAFKKLYKPGPVLGDPIKTPRPSKYEGMPQRKKESYRGMKYMLVFPPEEIKNVCELLNISAREMAYSIDVPVNTFRQCFSGRPGTPISLLDKFTQEAIYRNKSRKVELPDRVKLINPYNLMDECLERGIKSQGLCAAMNNQISGQTLSKFLHKRFGKNGPKYGKFKLITETLDGIPKLEKGQAKLYAEASTNKRQGEKNRLKAVKAIGDVDESGNPILSKEPKWDFWAAQKEWIQRDEEKLKNLPKTGHITRFTKTD